MSETTRSECSVSECRRPADPPLSARRLAGAVNGLLPYIPRQEDHRKESEASSGMLPQAKTGVKVMTLIIRCG